MQQEIFSDFVHEKLKNIRSHFDKVLKSIKDTNATYINLFMDAARNFPDFPLISDIGMDFISYNDFFTKVKNLSGWICSKCKRGELVGIYSNNRVDWILADLAIMMAGCITVPIYATFGKNALQDVIKETKMRMCFVGEKTFFDLGLCVEKIILIGGLKQNELMKNKNYNVDGEIESRNYDVYENKNLKINDEDDYNNNKINDDKINDDKINDDKINDDKINDDKINDDKINDDKIIDDKINSDKDDYKINDDNHINTNNKIKDINDEYKNLNSSDITKIEPENIKNNNENCDPYYENVDSFTIFDQIVRIFDLKKIISKSFPFMLDRLPGIYDVATICYTSGSTGLPKGVIITHMNLISVISGYFVSSDAKSVPKLDNTDVYMSYLPLAHVLEHFLILLMMIVPVKIVFFSGNRKNLQMDFQKVKPTFLVGVPRVFDAFKSKIFDAVPNKFLFKIALKMKYLLQPLGIYKNYFFDFLIFDRIKKKFGGNIKQILSGSAPLSKQLTQFIQAVFSCHVYQGYGQTETTGIVSITGQKSNSIGDVGLPYVTNKVKLSSENELMVRGENVFSGYFRNPELTRKTIINGWLRTGDMAEIRNNKIYITGRLKNNFKTSHGEYIVPEKIENIYKEILDDIFITGNSYKNFIVAIIVSKEPNILEKMETFSEKMVNENVLSKFEVPKKVFIVNQPFTADKRVMSATTFKIVREKLAKIYSKEIEEMLK
ncbi:Long-chain-fatty-acid--CoA ligase 5 [Dictyocoela muelleri]|nr:Long-chain-fatty-acid--CoA ligase 5 [Dictyocoela muelleri]